MNSVKQSYKFLKQLSENRLHTVIAKRYRYYWEARPENRKRKLLMQITLPRLGRSPVHEPENNDVNFESEKLFGLDLVLEKEAQDMLEKSKMIVVYLRSQMEISDYYRMRHALRKDNIYLEDFPNHVMTTTLKDTAYEHLASLYENQTLTLFSEELKVAEMLRIMRKVPYVSLMGGLVEERLMSANQIVEYNKLPPLDQCQSQLSFLLSANCASTSSILQRNQSMLSMSLSQYVKDNTKSSES